MFDLVDKFFKFSDVFGGQRKGALGTNGLKQKQLNSTETGWANFY